MKNLKALKELHRVIKNAPEHLLHMHSFTHTAPCGTAHCAAGFAAIDKWFVDNGLDFWGLSFDSLKQFFGLSAKQTNILFGGDLQEQDGDHAVTKKEVLDNITRLLNGKQPLKYKCLKGKVILV